MALTAASSLQITSARPSIFSAGKMIGAAITSVGSESNGASHLKLSSGFHISPIQRFQRSFMSSPPKYDRVVIKAMSEAGDKQPSSGLSLNLKGLLCSLSNFTRFIC